MLSQILSPSLVQENIFILTVFAAVGIVAWQIKQKNTFNALNSFPYPPKHWLLGNIPQVATALKQKKYFQLLFDWSKEFGPIYVFWTNVPIIILSKPKVIEETVVNGVKSGAIVRSTTTSAAWNDMTGPILIGKDGEEWQWRRKTWNPEFNSSSLSQYFTLINQACEQVIDEIKQQESKEIQVDFVFVKLTMSIIASLVLGVPIDKNYSSIEGPPLDVPKLHEAISIISYRLLRVAISEKRWMKYLPTKASQDYWRARRYLEAFIRPRVDLALQMREGKNIEGVSNLFKESMLVKIAAKQPKYNQKTLISEAIEFLIGGTDTTAHTLSFAVGELAQNPRVFEKARAIAHGQIDANNLKELNYIRAIVMETLRLYSVASISTSLEVLHNTVIEGRVIPPRTRIFWSALAAGRDPDTYSNPEEFLPERWLEKDQGKSTLPFMYFGLGPHRCLGEHLAMLEATVMLTLLLRNFDWELVNGRSSLDNLEQNILIYPADGMPVRFKMRKIH